MTTKLRFIEHPWWKDAHPDCVSLPGRCTSCAIAEDSSGRRFILWQSYGPDGPWSLSRNDPNYGSDLRLGNIELEGL